MLSGTFNYYPSLLSNISETCLYCAFYCLGKDATVEFELIGHSAEARKLAEKYEIGILQQDKPRKTLTVAAALTSKPQRDYKVLNFNAKVSESAVGVSKVSICSAEI